MNIRVNYQGFIESIVPGVLSIVRPLLRANPDLGRICISYPSGNSTFNPVFNKTLLPAGTIISSTEYKSAPAEWGVVYLGHRAFGCSNFIFTCTGCNRVVLSFFGLSTFHIL